MGKPDVPILQPGPWVDGLSRLFPFQEGGGAPRDIVNNNVITTTTPIWNASVNGGFRFRGTTGSAPPLVDVGYAVTTSSSFSFMAVMSFDDFPATFPYISGIFCNNSTYGLWLRLNSHAQIGLTRNPALIQNQDGPASQSYNPVRQNSLTTFLVVCSGGFARMWIDGEPQGTPQSLNFSTSSNLWAIGTEGTSVTDRYPIGGMEMLAWWDKALDSDTAAIVSGNPFAMIAPPKRPPAISAPLVGVLDKLSLNPRAAWSLRLVRTAYTGPIIRVRRSSDDAEQDFYADRVSGLLDAPAIVAWVGAGNDGFVRTWYDQTGNGWHGVQTILTYQPKLVSAGVWNNGVQVPYGASCLSLPESIMTGTSSATYVASFTQNADGGPLHLSYDAAYTHTPWSGGACYEGFCSTARQLFVNYGPANHAIIHSATQNGTQLSIWRNGVAGGTQNTAYNVNLSGKNPRITPGDYGGGTTRELFLFGDALSDTNRAKLEQNSALTWGVTDYKGYLLGWDFKDSKWQDTSSVNPAIAVNDPVARVDSTSFSGIPTKPLLSSGTNRPLVAAKGGIIAGQPNGKYLAAIAANLGTFNSAWFAFRAEYLSINAVQFARWLSVSQVANSDYGGDGLAFQELGAPGTAQVTVDGFGSSRGTAVHPIDGVAHNYVITENRGPVGPYLTRIYRDGVLINSVSTIGSSNLLVMYNLAISALLSPTVNTTYSSNIRWEALHIGGLTTETVLTNQEIASIFAMLPLPDAVTRRKSADQNNKKEGVDMPIYKGAAYRHQWLSETSAGAINSTTKPVVVLKQNSGTGIAIDPARVINAGNGNWYVDFSALEMAYDYISVIATDATLMNYGFNTKTDDATAAISNMAVDFTNVIRPHILTILNSVWTGSVSVLQRIGGLTGTGINTIYGFLLAMVNKTATKPTDMGGTFDPATDSMEALRDRGDAAWLTGGGGGGMTIEKLVPSTKYQLSSGQVQAIGTVGQKVRLDVSSGTIGLIVGVANNVIGAPVVAEQRSVGEHSFELTDTSYVVALSKNVSFSLSVIT
jgi:hypothetical protein